MPDAIIGDIEPDEPAELEPQIEEDEVEDIAEEVEEEPLPVAEETIIHREEETTDSDYEVLAPLEEMPRPGMAARSMEDTTIDELLEEVKESENEIRPHAEEPVEVSPYAQNADNAHLRDRGKFSSSRRLIVDGQDLDLSPSLRKS